MRLETSMNHNLLNFLFKYIALKGSLITHGKSFPICQASKLNLFNLSTCYVNGFVIWMDFDNLNWDLSNAHNNCYKSLCLRMRSHFIIVVYETSQIEQCLIPKLGPKFWLKDSKL
jgi:hypothetical protein